MKKIFFTSIIIILAFSAGYFAFKYFTQNEQGSQNQARSHKDATYIIEGRSIKLAEGSSEIEVVTDSASKIVTRYFGNEVQYDFDGDGREDVAFLLTQQAGGSGVFYYVVAALNTENGYIGSHGLFLGDRIAPQTTEMSRDSSRTNVIVVNYADRAQGESFANSPSFGKSIWLLLNIETMQFGEVAQNFEGEADPSRMTLGMKTWAWMSTLYNDGKKIMPKQPGIFTIAFLSDGTFSATTDCNSISGGYTVDAYTISFGPITSTKMYCDGSQEADFVALLESAQSYHFTSKGELILDLKFDSGSAIFK